MVPQFGSSRKTPTDKKRSDNEDTRVGEENDDEEEYTEELYLSPEAIQALKEFSKEYQLEDKLMGKDKQANINLKEDDNNDDGEDDILFRLRMQDLFTDQERDEVFCYTYGDILKEEGENQWSITQAETQNTKEGKGPYIEIRLFGWNKELGQQLDSTGLTMWRAGEDLGEYLYTKRKELGLIRSTSGLQRDCFSVLELGAGLGLAGLLIHKLNPNPAFCKVYITDGDEISMEKLHYNVQMNKIDISEVKDEKDMPNSKSKEIENTSFLNFKDKRDEAVQAQFLYWGKHEEYLQEFFPDNLNKKMDLIVASDVIYEETAILPLLTTVKALLKSEKDEGRFILAFARRNVSIDKVFSVAEKLGFSMTADKSFVCSNVNENIYLLTLP